MSQSAQIIAIGLLTQRDLDILGRRFDRAFPIDDELVFEDLLRAIDEADRAMQAGGDAPASPAEQAEMPADMLPPRRPA